MAAGAWQVYDEGLEDILDGTVDLDTDTIKCQLHTVTYTPTDADTSVTNEHANGNGYTTGGITCTITVVNASGTVTIDSTTNPQWTASGGDIVAGVAVLIRSGDTQPLFYCDLDTGGGNLTATNGNTFTITFHASGICTVAQA
jgi:hypothetical protein